MAGNSSEADLQPTPADSVEFPGDYASFLSGLKECIQQAQVKAALAVNRELLLLYWDLGRRIVIQQEREGWGASVIERLARDLQSSFPGLAGFSRSNIWRMRAFYLAYSRVTENLAQPAREINDAKLAQAVRELGSDSIPRAVTEIPWGHNVLLIQKVKDPVIRLWYVCQTIEQGWSRAILQAQIESKLYERQGKALTNFKRTLPPLESDLAQQTLKDPYNFDFLTLRHEAQERDLEQGLLEHIKDFLLELGTGFAFIGSQVPLEIEDQTYYLDLLFYHTRLRRYVVIELKARQFQPEFAGKLNFYLSAVDDLIKGSEDKATIGLILCKTHKRYIVEYALREMGKPIGVAGWKTRLLQSLPEELRGSMPTIEEIEAELQDRLDRE